ncbi:hypothetical protein Lepto7375DRAFT_0910 [Leptolyngbya sp. PCC 7375]|nr:hypothetical protein Lepto7375DRAFT_0910 [Leptolyngbya sp. PCC 7375]
MTDQNSAVEHQIRPNALMEELGIKKDAYYSYLKHLGFKAEKDSDGKAFLNEGQANLMRALRAHVVEGGKIEEFVVSNSDPAALATMNAGEMDSVSQATDQQAADPAHGLDLDALMSEAAELAGHRMTLGQQMVLKLAEQMTYDDLPDHVRVKVDSVRQATNPKHQNLSSMATDLLSQWRQKRQELQTA